jgi:single-strand DNA-binding protein
MNETLVTIIGTVITDVTPRKTQDGTRVASFRVASNQRKFDRESQAWVDGDSLFVSVTCWRDLARHVTSSLVKGDPVIVMGRLYTRRYELEGQKRSITELDARTVGPDLSRCTVEVVQRRRRDAGEAVNGTVDGAAIGAVNGAAGNPAPTGNGEHDDPGAAAGNGAEGSVDGKADDALDAGSGDGGATGGADKGDTGRSARAFDARALQAVASSVR